MFNNKVCLASQSPRRRALVGKLFNNIKILDVNVDEPRPLKTEAPLDYLDRCLKAKWAGSRAAAGSDWMIVADTIVVLGREVLGKPVDARDAALMLGKMSGRTHQVLTGLMMGRRGAEPSCRIGKTSVTFGHVSAGEIRAYVRSGAPFDKAGAYGFQDQALRFVSRLEGSYLNVVGLPLGELKDLARSLGVE
jgi:septum formation protein